jgi:glycosyltransferase involved in cell wall biosynthesis
MNKMHNEFILMTPAKDEEKFLPLVIKSLVKSEKLPILWLIVNDGSTDDTLKIIKKASNDFNFIKYISIKNKGKRDLIYRISYVCKLGFEYAINYAKNNGIKWNYIGILDADIMITKNYFKGIINEMDKNPKIGISSGKLLSYTNKQIKLIKYFDNIPTGGARIWSKNCFLKTRYTISQSPDSVSTAKANIFGWETKRFKNYLAYELRETSSAEGLWRGNMVNGLSSYYLNYHPILLLFTLVTLFSKKRFYLIVPFISGYLISVVKKYPKIEDKEVKYYFWHTRFISRIKNIAEIKRLLER